MLSNNPSQLDKEFSLFLQNFEGKETEANWKSRDNSIRRFQTLLNASPNRELTASLRSGTLKAVIDVLISAMQSLRTTLALTSCSAINTCCEVFGTGMDLFGEKILAGGVKVVTSTKKLTSSAALTALDALVGACTYQYRNIQILASLMENKNVLSRSAAVVLLKTAMAKVDQPGTRDTVVQTGGVVLIESIIRSGLSDASGNVREQSRVLFGLYANLWPVDKFAKTLSASSRKQVMKILGESPQTVPEKRRLRTSTDPTEYRKASSTTSSADASPAKSDAVTEEKETRENFSFQMSGSSGSASDQEDALEIRDCVAMNQAEVDERRRKDYIEDGDTTMPDATNPAHEASEMIDISLVEGRLLDETSPFERSTFMLPSQNASYVLPCTLNPATHSASMASGSLESVTKLPGSPTVLSSSDKDVAAVADGSNQGKGSPVHLLDLPSPMSSGKGLISPSTTLRNLLPTPRSPRDSDVTCEFCDHFTICFTDSRLSIAKFVGRKQNINLPELLFQKAARLLNAHSECVDFLGLFISRLKDEDVSKHLFRRMMWVCRAAGSHTTGAAPSSCFAPSLTSEITEWDWAQDVWNCRSHVAECVTGILDFLHESKNVEQKENCLYLLKEMVTYLTPFFNGYETPLFTRLVECRSDSNRLICSAAELMLDTFITVFDHQRVLKAIFAFLDTDLNSDTSCEDVTDDEMCQPPPVLALPSAVALRSLTRHIERDNVEELEQIVFALNPVICKGFRHEFAAVRKATFDVVVLFRKKTRRQLFSLTRAQESFLQRYLKENRNLE